MVRLKQASEIKYYLYISDEKLEMLHQQVAPSNEGKKSFDWGLDFHFIKINRKSERQTENSRDDKLKAVIQALDDANLVGTVDNPNQYFKATLPMKWGMLRDWGRPADESPLVYFGGRTEKTMFGLGGSSKHIIGTAGASSTDSRSSAPSIVGQILTGLNMASQGWNTAPRLSDEDHHSTYEAIEWANKNLKWAPEQNIEFYAKTLLSGDHYLARDQEPVKVLLGSPIYAALAHPYTDFSYCE